MNHSFSDPQLNSVHYKNERGFTRKISDFFSIHFSIKILNNIRFFIILLAQKNSYYKRKKLFLI